jgi:hypothetical protein
LSVGVVGRALILFAAGVLLVSTMVLVGAPRPVRPPPATAVTARPIDGDDVLDRGELITWCRRVLGERATAERFDGTWWCAGRPGGVWRSEELDVPAACEAIGRADRRRMPGDEGIDCDS